MSFSTSSSEAHRRFAFRLIVLVTLPVAGLFVLGIYFQPLFGDLTRIGFFSEREFGWNTPQVIFKNSRLDFSASPLNDRHYDILVLGDSFSWERPEMQWQNYLAAATGLSVGTVDLYKFSLNQVLSSKAFRNHPPRVLVFESAERGLPGNLKVNMPGCADNPVPYRGSSVAIPVVSRWKNDLAGSTWPLERKTAWNEINPGYMLNALLHKLLSVATYSPVYKVNLAFPAPFSSRNRRELLVFRDDREKTKWWLDMGLPMMGCRIEAMKRKVEANGQTRFVLMVAPDKLTAYADFLQDRDAGKGSRLAELVELHQEVMPGFDRALIGAIRSGEPDVYFPDDTHWGSNGQRIAAETLVAFLHGR